MSAKKYIRKCSLTELFYDFRRQRDSDAEAERSLLISHRLGYFRIPELPPPPFRLRPATGDRLWIETKTEKFDGADYDVIEEADAAPGRPLLQADPDLAARAEAAFADDGKNDRPKATPTIDNMPLTVREQRKAEAAKREAEREELDARLVRWLKSKSESKGLKADPKLYWDDCQNEVKDAELADLRRVLKRMRKESGLVKPRQRQPNPGRSEQS